MDYGAAAEELIALFQHTRSETADRMQRHMKGEGFALHILGDCMQGVAQPGQIAAATGISSARVAALLGALERKELITRETDQNDRRKVLVRLSAAGREALEQKHREIHGMWEQVLRELGENDTRELLRLGRRLAELHFAKRKKKGSL
ncbi:MAG: MarR family transcriptional regulator [Oscillospiraceae bacterium]|jgi:DNA-binding MarR family transcriptional regulator|nr:MarR family transcriptional regulator [Oscillospiraceae bacterium]